MTKELTELIARKVEFYSQMDESNFFAWAQRIPVVKNIFGRGDAIVLECTTPPIPDNSLRDLFALFVRYGVEVEQLRIFETGKSHGWLVDSLRERQSAGHVNVYPSGKER